MRKPENIALGIVGAVAGGLAITALSSRVTDRPSVPVSSYRSSSGTRSNPVPFQERDYQNGEYVPTIGYYHAPYHNFFFYPWNHYDTSKGYYRGGQWFPQMLSGIVPASRPSAEALQRLRALYAQQQQQQSQQPASSSSGHSSAFRYHSGSSFGGTSRGFGGSSSSSTQHSSFSSGRSSSSSHTSFGGFGSRGSSSS